MFSKETKIQVYEAQNGYCAEFNCLESIHSFHHKLHDTSYNRKKFPLLINSPINCVGLCYKGHRDNQWKFRITEKVAEVYEQFLRRLKNE